MRLFVDASVLIAAAASPEGGSALLVEICRAKKASALLTRLVLREAERNIRDKLDERALLRFYELIADLEAEIIPFPAAADLEAAAEVVDAKDAHVLAGARAGQATHLVTLDRKHFLHEKQRQGILPIIACTPGELIGSLATGEGGAGQPPGSTPS